MKYIEPLETIRFPWAKGAGVQIASRRPNHLLILNELIVFPSIAFAYPLPRLCQNPAQFGLTVPKLGPVSFANRFNFARASRFICNFICEYFLNTFASPCRNNWVTHSSATPPALSRVA